MLGYLMIREWERFCDYFFRDIVKLLVEGMRGGGVEDWGREVWIISF